MTTLESTNELDEGLQQADQVHRDELLTSREDPLDPSTEQDADQGVETVVVTSSVPAKAPCFNCGRRVARDGCTQSACLQCCTDANCERHKKSKEHAVWREQVLAGTTDTQVLAARLRSKLIPARRFRESGFVYQGDTVVIFDIREYLSNPHWRADAIRKCRRRRVDSLVEANSANQHGKRRNRFNKVTGELLSRSMEK